MFFQSRSIIYLAAVIVTVALTGCGQTGALYLSEAQQHLPEAQQQLEKKTNEKLNGSEKNAGDRKESPHASDGSQP